MGNEANRQAEPARSEAPARSGRGLHALYLNCTLKRSPRPSHTQGLIDLSRTIVESSGVEADSLRVVDYALAPGVQPDMTAVGEGAWSEDDWPDLFERVRAADIVVIGTPIWLGEKSSICSRLIERLYAMSAMTNDRGQYVYYGKVGGCLVTGNEDGVKHCAMNLLYSLQHLGFAIPPQADAGWIGAVGPGPSYRDPGSGGPESDFTNRTTTFMAWNLIHLARMLKDQGGIPAHGNQPGRWEEGERFGHPGPDFVPTLDGA